MQQILTDLDAELQNKGHVNPYGLIKSPSTRQDQTIKLNVPFFTFHQMPKKFNVMFLREQFFFKNA